MTSPFDSVGVLLFGLVLVVLGFAAWKWHLKAITRLRNDTGQAIEARTRELADATLRADEASRIKSEFLAKISSEIRTQLTSALGTLDLVLTTELTPEQREYLELSRRSEESLLTLLDDMLEFSRMETGRVEIEHVAFRLRECITSVAASSEIAVATQVAPEVPDQMVGDPYRLRHVILKVINDLVKSFPQDHFLIAVQFDPNTGQTREAGNRWRMLLFSIQHRTARLPWKAHEAFAKTTQQIGGSTTRTYGGGALGLDVCNRLVKLMGGTVWIDSEDEGKNRFYFTIEVEVPQSTVEELPSAARKDNSPVQSPPRREGARVLVVDDNSVNRVVVTRMLEKRGFVVLTASNGPEALRVLESESVDIVLMDVLMPGMDGYETTRRIRAGEAPSGSHIPILAVTANALPEDRQECLRAGMDDYISKPIQSKQLFQIVDDLLARPPASSVHARYAPAAESSDQKELLH